MSLSGFDRVGVLELDKSVFGFVMVFWVFSWFLGDILMLFFFSKLIVMWCRGLFCLVSVVLGEDLVNIFGSGNLWFKVVNCL